MCTAHIDPATRSIVGVTGVICAESFQKSKKRQQQKEEEEEDVAAIIFPNPDMISSLLLFSPVVLEQREMESTVAQQMASHTLTVPGAHSVTSAMLPLWAQTLRG